MRRKSTGFWHNLSRDLFLLRDLCEQTLPTLDRLPAGEICIEHFPGAPAHFGATQRVPRQCRERAGKTVRVAWLNGNAARMPRYQLGDVAVFGGDGNHRPARGGNAVKLAWKNQPFELAVATISNGRREPRENI